MSIGCQYPEDDGVVDRVRINIEDKIGFMGLEVPYLFSANFDRVRCCMTSSFSVLLEPWGLNVFPRIRTCIIMLQRDIQRFSNVVGCLFKNSVLMKRRKALPATDWSPSYKGTKMLKKQSQIIVK